MMSTSTASRSLPPLIVSSEGNVPMSSNITASSSSEENPMDHGITAHPFERRFSPYDFNGGTVAAIAGDDYVVVAADTRLSSGYEILSRQVTKLHAVTPSCVLASSGCKTDVDQLRSVLDIKGKVRAKNERSEWEKESARELKNNLKKTREEERRLFLILLSFFIPFSHRTHFTHFLFSLIHSLIL